MEPNQIQHTLDRNRYRDSKIAQCCGSVCLWTSRIRIRHYFVQIRILASASKINKNYLDFYYFLTSFSLFKTDVNVPLKSNKQKEKKTYFFVDTLSATDEESRIRIPMSVVRIHGSGSVPKCHGSTTLVLRQHSILLHQELPKKPDVAE
jgi:hypothetical protein